MGEPYWGLIQFAHEPYLSYTQLTHAPYPFCLVDKVAVMHRVNSSRMSPIGFIPLTGEPYLSQYSYY